MPKRRAKSRLLSAASGETNAAAGMSQLTPMKKLFPWLVILALTGCRNTGYNDRSLSDSATSSTSQKEYVRTYDQNGNANVTPVTPASKSDPASPDYHAP